jgi:hypothetical protein
VILDRSPAFVDAFFAAQALRPLSQDEKLLALKLMEMQRHAMLMYTSCGWFFDELSGIETTQVIQYAARTLQLFEEIAGDSLEPMFLERMERAQSNIPEHENGRIIYEKFVKPAMVDREKVAAHYVLMSLFDPYPEDSRVYCYRVQLEDYEVNDAGKTRLVVGRARIKSEITQESDTYTFGAIHMGDHLMNAGVRVYQGEEAYNSLKQDLANPFSHGDFAQMIRILDRHFGEFTYSLRSIFHDDQRKILNIVMKSTIAEAEAIYRQLYDTHAAMMRFVADLRVPMPRAFMTAAEFALNSTLRAAFGDSDNLDFPRIASLLEEARRNNVPLDGATLGFTLRRTIRRLSEQFMQDPENVELMKKLEAAAGIACDLPFEVNIWRAQNNYYQMLQRILPDFDGRAANGDPAAGEWVDHFIKLGHNLAVKVEHSEDREGRRAS